MKAHELIGKKAIRKAPNKHGDYSFSTDPVEIIKVTDGHILFKAAEGIEKKLLGEEVHVLNSSWLDNNWADYDELLNDGDLTKREVNQTNDTLLRLLELIEIYSKANVLRVEFEAFADESVYQIRTTKELVEAMESEMSYWEE